MNSTTQSKPTPSEVQVKASFYADGFEGRPMAGGGRFRQSIPSCASLQYPLGTQLRLTSVKTGRSVILTVTDRGPWTKLYQLDLSKAAFTALGLDLRAGWGWVTVQVQNHENFPEESQ